MARKVDFVIRLERDDREALRELAESDGVSMAEWVRRVLARSLAARRVRQTVEP